MAVVHSKLGGCFGETAKLGPLASTDLCALVKGLLDKLITHFGLGSSMEEEPWGLFCLLVKEEDLASWEAPAWKDTTWEAPLSGWEIALSVLGVLPAWELLLGEACEAPSLAECLTTRVAWGMPTLETSLSAWGRVLSAGEAWRLPAWEAALSTRGRALSAWGDWGMPAWETALSAWERVLSARETWELPAWETVLSARGRVLSAWEVWGEALGVISLPACKFNYLPAWELFAACEALMARFTWLFTAQEEALAAGETWELCQVILPSWLYIFPLLSLGYTFHTPAGSEHTQWTCHLPYKVLFFNYPSDLMKSTVVDESLSSMNLQFCSRENQLLQLLQQNEKPA